jgi:hypothetical protein
MRDVGTVISEDIFIVPWAGAIAIVWRVFSFGLSNLEVFPKDIEPYTL